MSGMHTAHGDPGWPSGRRILAMLVPPLAFAGSAGQPMVMVLRQLLVGFWLVLAGFGMVVFFTFRDGPEPTDSAVAWVLLAVGGLMSLAGAGFARRRPLACGEPGALAAQYRITFFIGVAFAETAALLGFVAAFTIGAAWPYVVSIVPTAVAFGLFAPTRGRLEAVDRQLQASGCPHSLRTALYASGDELGAAPRS